MVLRALVTTEEYHHRKEGITARIQVTILIKERLLEDLQVLQIREETNQNSTTGIEDLIQKQPIARAGQVEIIPALDTILPKLEIRRLTPVPRA